jgi:hypothetical protein
MRIVARKARSCGIVTQMNTNPTFALPDKIIVSGVYFPHWLRGSGVERSKTGVVKTYPLARSGAGRR